jgi:hypothetical protein
MSAQSDSVGPQHGDVVVACPPWCAARTGTPGLSEPGEGLHVSGRLVVNRTVLRLASSVDPDTGIPDGPLVYVGEEEYTLHQAEVLIDALTRLVAEGTGPARKD